LAAAFTALSVLSALSANDTPVDFAEQSPRDRMLGLAAAMVMQSLGPVLLLFVAATSKANASDLGLPPRTTNAWLRDAGIGVFACLAAIVPVGLVIHAVNWLLKLPNQLTKHPVVEMLTKSEPDLLVLAVATLMAVVVAPIAEEITFRLLLQGWLEKWEDREIGWRDSPIDPSAANEALDAELPPDTPPEFADEASVGLTTVTKAPPKYGIAGLPYGWTPIIVSSSLFAAAHAGYGPEPVPLFVLALVLGYCYQRTHRIIPCIVAHGLFNMLSMIALWRVVLITAE
jgi:membrane protease YdiL (CAAX protease family)